MFLQLMNNLAFSDFPRPWQVSFQKPATTMMEGIIDLHHDIFTFLIIILVFVSFILGTILWRYVEPRKWKTAQTRFPLMQFQNGHGITHDTTLEIIWTIIPTFVLLFIATPSFALIYALDEIVDPELTIRVIGRQWYWTYEYPDHLTFDVQTNNEMVGNDFYNELAVSGLPIKRKKMNFDQSRVWQQQQYLKPTMGRIQRDREMLLLRMPTDPPNPDDLPYQSWLNSIGFEASYSYLIFANHIFFQRREAEGAVWTPARDIHPLLPDGEDMYFVNTFKYPRVAAATLFNSQQLTEADYKKMVSEADMSTKFSQIVTTIQPKVMHMGFRNATVLAFNVPGFAFNSYIVPTEDLFPGAFRLLEVDRRVVLPVQTNIRVLVTSYDVLHSWTVPAFGIKVDALPGRLNEYFLNANFMGIFYGQCSEICGVNHGFMPIKVEITTPEQFKWWFFQTSLIENPPAKFRELMKITRINFLL